MSRELDLAAKTLFADFQESVFSRVDIERRSLRRPIYVQKRVKGKIYWYDQVYENGVAKQKYVGPDEPSLRKKVEKAREETTLHLSTLANLKEQETRLARMLARAGLPMMDSRMSVVLNKFSDAQLIDGRGVLVGTFAFAAYSGILGVILERASLRTQDVDIAQDPRIELAHEIPLEASKFFSQPGLECRPVPALSHKNLPPSFVTNDGIRIDLLIPLIGRGPRIPRQPGIRGAGATPLRFLDYLIQNPIRTVLLSTKGGISITVPAPEHFAIHKLLIAPYRTKNEHQKKAKDLLQASQLIEVMVNDQNEALLDAYRDAISRGPKWKRAILESISKLPEAISQHFGFNS